MSPSYGDESFTEVCTGISVKDINVMRSQSIAIVAVFTVFFGCMVGGQEKTAPYPGARIVKSFSVQRISPLEALVRFGDQERLPLGVVCSDDGLLSTQISIEENDKPVDMVLADILMNTAYKATKGSYGAIRIADSGKLGENPVLNHVFSRFRTYRSVDTTLISEMLWGQFQMTLNPERHGYGGVLRVQGQDRKLPEVDLPNASVGDVLDWAVVHHGAMMWILWPLPEHLLDAPQYRLWNLVYYSSPDKGGLQTCCLYLPEDLKQVPEAVRKRLTH